jgi:hypothetical protein
MKVFVVGGSAATALFPHQGSLVSIFGGCQDGVRSRERGYAGGQGGNVCGEHGIVFNELCQG